MGRRTGTSGLLSVIRVHMTGVWLGDITSQVEESSIRLISITRLGSHVKALSAAYVTSESLLIRDDDRPAKSVALRGLAAAMS